MTTSARATLDRDLNLLNDDLLRLGGLVERAIERGMRSLADRDPDLARRVDKDDEQVNLLRREIERSGIALIATQQPNARDLRRIIAAITIAGDLERMADHAAGIARIVIRMGDEPLLKPLIDMPRMAGECRSMLHDVLDAYVQHDAPRARSIAARDDIIDELYKQIFRELLSFMVEDPRTTSRALYLLFAAHNFERIGDHITNVAEQVVFVERGEIEELNPEPNDTHVS
jgi:phosphate transport system protein